MTQTQQEQQTSQTQQPTQTSQTSQTSLSDNPSHTADSRANQPDTFANTFDVVIIGGGPGGYSTALRAAELGKSVALVEEDERPGGTCLNEGCVPSKALLRTTDELRNTRDAARMGIDMRLEAVDLSRLLGFKNHVVVTEVTGLEGLLKARGVTVFQAYGAVHPDLSVTLLPSHANRRGKQGTFGLHTTDDSDDPSDPYGAPRLTHVIDTETVIHGDDIVIATGSHPRALPGADFSEHAILDSRAALSLHQIPQSVIIIGSGAIGSEFATLWNGLGAKVTILEAAPRIMPGFTRRMSAFETRAMRRAGITIETGVHITSVEEGANQLATVRYEDASPAGPSLRPAGAITPADPSNPNNKSAAVSSASTSATQPSSAPANSSDAADATAPSGTANSAPAASPSQASDQPQQQSHGVSAQFVLVSIGRVPNTNMGWMDECGIERDQRGLIHTDPYGRTNKDHVWALGDITPGKQLAHRAFAQGLVVAESIAGVPTTPVDDRTVPAVSYALEHVAEVGYDRESAIKSGEFAEVEEKSFPTGGNARVVMENEQGVVTVVSGYAVDGDGHKQGERLILGVQMIGPMVSELASEAEELVGNRVPLHEAARLIHPHPTFSETLGEALLAADGRPLHSR